MTGLLGGTFIRDSICIQLPLWVERGWKWLVPLIILDIALKGFALWRSAKRGEKAWFISLLFVNSMGIYPAFYLLTHKEGIKKTSSDSG